MAYQSHIRCRYLASIRRMGGMLEIVKDVNLTADCFSCNDIEILRHVSRFVDLSLMIDLYLNCNFAFLAG